MEIAGSSGSDALAFYVDGIRQATSYGSAVTVQRTWTDAATHLLMWEFTRGSGTALIRNLSR
jgi:hypothetical protein